MRSRVGRRGVRGPEFAEGELSVGNSPTAGRGMAGTIVAGVFRRRIFFYGWRAFFQDAGTQFCLEVVTFAMRWLSMPH